VLDPLTQTQVVAYLEGLAAKGYKILLLSYERSLTDRDRREMESQLRAKGITWYRSRYHKWPSVPATAWDIMRGVLLGLWIVRRHKVELVHARSHVPGLMGLLLKRLAGVKLLFDLRGLMAEEYVDAGIWLADGWLFRCTKRVERLLIRKADGIIVLTEKARQLLTGWYGDDLSDKPLQVIPCCVDLRSDPSPSPAVRNGLKFVYVGKLGGWYLTEQMADFMAISLRRLPSLQWQVWTQSDAALLRRLLKDREIDERVQIGQMAAEALPSQLRLADAGLAFIKPCRSKLASSPTKVGEYLAAGLPVIANGGIGDLDRLLGGQRPEDGVGVLVDALDEEGLSAGVQQIVALLDDPGLRQRCRRVAQQELDLVGVGWNRYRAMYQALIGPPSRP
jgi:glycosyltransferase involved in cell wall biosynthesis